MTTAVLVALLGWASATTPGMGAAPVELWYQVELAGQAAGWLVEREELRGGELVTESEMRLEFRRSAAAVSIEMASRFVETADGSPLRAWTWQKLGALPIESTFEFGRDGVTVRHVQADSGVREEKLPWPAGEWLTPGAAERRMREEIARGAKELSIRTLDPLLGLEPVTMRWVHEAEDQEVLTTRGPIRTTRWRQTASYAPRIATLVFVDPGGLLVRSETSMMGLEMTLALSERETVLERPAESPELLVRSFVRPDRRIERPRQVRRAVYELEIDGESLPEIPSVGAQRARTVGPKAWVTVEPESSQVATEAGADYLRSTTYLPHDDPRIRELLERALGSGEKRTDLERAEALRAFVADYLVAKDLNTVLATAAEVAATRSGDCTEHSVLLAALFRAAGVPSRVVSGLVYVERFAGEEEIFGFHMWTQALVDGRWTDFDATLPESRFDAAHIALSTSSLGSDGTALQEMARVLPLMGRLEIRVLEVDYPE